MLECKPYFRREFQAIIKIGGGSVPTFTGFALIFMGNKGSDKEKKNAKILKAYNFQKEFIEEKK